jgi:Raf kinase inhibitor-like YbhB/YbcL family protein
MKRLLFGLLAACGGNGSDTPAADAAIDGTQIVDASIDAPPSGAFALTSPTITMGAMFPAAHTCTGPGNTSPQLVWTAGPAGTLSYAVIFTDKSNNLIHWIIYDIPASATGLPASVQKAYQPNNVTGAKQTDSYQAGMRGYLGPCPPNQHTYEFAVYAVDVATLPAVTMASTRADVSPVILAHDLARAALSGTYVQPN